MIYQNNNGIITQTSNIYENKSTTQRINSKYENVNGVVKQVYNNKLLLYDIGNECINITGGWSGVNSLLEGMYTYVAPTKNTSDITLNATGNSLFCDILTENKIDVTSYGYITINILERMYEGTGYFNIILLPNRISLSGAVELDLRYEEIVAATKDISAVTGEYYVGVLINGSAGVQRNVRMMFDKIWLSL